MSDLHLRFNEGETLLVSVESSDKFDNSTLRWIVRMSRLCQVLRRTTANERTTENSAANARAMKIRSAARHCEEE